MGPASPFWRANWPVCANCGALIPPAYAGTCPPTERPVAHWCPGCQNTARIFFEYIAEPRPHRHLSHIVSDAITGRLGESAGLRARDPIFVSLFAHAAECYLERNPRNEIRNARPA